MLPARPHLDTPNGTLSLDESAPGKSAPGTPNLVVGRDILGDCDVRQDLRFWEEAADAGFVLSPDLDGINQTALRNDTLGCQRL
jgi:hypothetical protein